MVTLCHDRESRWKKYLSAPVDGLRLAPYHVRAVRMTDTGDTWWTECEMHFDDPLGRDRAIMQWAMRERQASRETALRFVRTVNVMVDETGTVRHIADIERVPAILHKDWHAYAPRLLQVASASWCWCGGAPASSPGGDCVWCVEGGGP